MLIHHCVSVANELSQHRATDEPPLTVISGCLPYVHFADQPIHLSALTSFIPSKFPSRIPPQFRSLQSPLAKVIENACSRLRFTIHDSYSEPRNSCQKLQECIIQSICELENGNAQSLSLSIRYKMLIQRYHKDRKFGNAYKEIFLRKYPPIGCTHTLQPQAIFPSSCQVHPKPS